MRRMPLAGIENLDPETTLLTGLQHRPPLEIFNLYAVDGASGTVWKWTPPVAIPVTFPDPPESFLTSEPDLDPAVARDLRADANLWLLHRATVTRVNFGTPVPQSDYSLDPPPDAAVRDALNYTLFDTALVGDRDQFFVYDAPNARSLPSSAPTAHSSGSGWLPAPATPPGSSTRSWASRSCPWPTGRRPRFC